MSKKLTYQVTPRILEQYMKISDGNLDAVKNLAWKTKEISGSFRILPKKASNLKRIDSFSYSFLLFFFSFFFFWGGGGGRGIT
jgi:hypothetical protein